MDGRPGRTGLIILFFVSNAQAIRALLLATATAVIFFLSAAQLLESIVCLCLDACWSI